MDCERRTEQLNVGVCQILSKPRQFCRLPAFGSRWREAFSLKGIKEVRIEIGGQGRNRTTDTRIFSPLLYQLSYLANLGEALEQSYLTENPDFQSLPTLSLRDPATLAILPPDRRRARY